jgi:choline-sulfatase
MLDRRTFLLSSTTAALAKAAPEPRPNFLFLIADDLTFRAVGALGNTEVHTPNIDRLMERGCTFTHCFHQGSWQGAVCVASRTMLHTGLTAFRARREVEHTPLWGQTFGDAGYATDFIGKWHIGPGTLKRSFKEQGPVFMEGMFESGPDAYNRPAPGNTWTPWDTSRKGQWLPTQLWEKGAKEPVKHSAAIWADAAIERLAAHAGRPDPFLLYVGFTSPHDPRQAPREFVERYPAGRVAIPPSYLPQHPFDQGDARVRDELLAPFPRTREAVQLHRSEYYAHVTYFDAQVGRILEALDRSGQTGSTVVILTADHGLAVGEHGLMGKQNLYDHSVRMPYVVTGPGIPKGRKIDALMYQHSTFATACELAGIATPKSVEFPSVAPLIRGDAAPPHDAVFCYYRDFQRSVRTQEHKLILYPQAGVTQLFDLKKDPWEMANVADQPAYRAVREHLQERLRRFQSELDDNLK